MAVAFGGGLLAQDWNRDVLMLRPAKVVGEKTVLDELRNRAEEALSVIRRARTSHEADAARAALRHRLEESLGFRLLPRDPVLSARVAGTLERDDYRIEKIVYDAGYAKVSAHLYTPRPTGRPFPAVLFYPGHWWEGKALADFQVFCINMARMGFAVLIWDPFGQGERGVSTRDHRRAEALLVGVSQEGLAEYETQCAIAYLLSRNDVDPKRIGMTGASGGGYNTWMTAALDDRIAAAVPVVGTSEFLQQIDVTRSYNWDPADYCHYLPGLIQYANNHELLAMAAPKPIRIIAADDDKEFGVTGVRSVYDYGRELYASYGVPGKISMFDDQSAGHGYQKKKREAAYGWFRRWLMDSGDGGAYPESYTPTLPYDSIDLRCFPPGFNEPAGPGIIESVKRLSRDRPKNPANYSLASILGLPGNPVVRLPIIQNVKLQRLLVPGENGIELPAFLLKPEARAKGILIAVEDGGKEALANDLDLKQILAERWAILGLDPRGIGELSTGKMAWVSAVSALLNENFVGRQAWDIIRGIELLRAIPEFGGLPLVLYARGPNTALASTYVVGLRSGLERVALRDSFITFRHFFQRPRSMNLSFTLAGSIDDKSVFLDHEIPLDFFVFGALREFDLPDLLGAAPVKVTVVNPIDGDWDHMGETEARNLLPSRIRVLCAKAPEDRIARLLLGLDTN